MPDPAPQPAASAASPVEPARSTYRDPGGSPPGVVLPPPDTTPGFSFACFLNGTHFETPGGAFGACTVKSLNGYSGDVQMSVITPVPEGSFAIPPGWSGSLPPDSSFGGVLHSNFSNWAPGFYTVEFAATSNGMTKTSSIMFTLVERPPD